MKIAIAVILLGLSLSGCALLAAGAAGVGWEAHRHWCVVHYGNPYCYQQAPMGVHR